MSTIFRIIDVNPDPSGGYEPTLKSDLLSHAAFHTHARRRRREEKKKQTVSGTSGDDGDGATELSAHALSLIRQRLQDRSLRRSGFSLHKGDDWTINLIFSKSQDFMDLRQQMYLFFSQELMLRHLIPETQQHFALLSSLAYMACSTLDALRNHGQSVTALLVKGKVVQAMNQRFSNSRAQVDIVDFATVTSLASTVAVYEGGFGPEHLGAPINADIEADGHDIQYLMHRKGIEAMAVIMAQQANPARQSSPVELLINRTIALHRHMAPVATDLQVPPPEYPDPDFGYGDDRFRMDGDSRGGNTKMILESPFYCPEPGFRYVQRSKYCDARLLRLLCDLRDYLELLEIERDIESRVEKEAFCFAHRLALRVRLLAHESIHSPSTSTRAGTGRRIMREKDYIYECVRLCGLVIVHLSDTCLPCRAAFPVIPPNPPDTASTTTLPNFSLSTAAPPPSTTPPLTRSSPSTRPDISVLPLIDSPAPSHILRALAYNIRKGPNALAGWDLAMRGVLYFVTNVAGAISVGHPEALLIISLGSKGVFDMTMSSNERTWDEAYLPLRTFTEFRRLCLNERIVKLTTMDDYDD
ncbi:uncharacterized protein Z519_03704 [Cladophialophora bantiana CBS 173.52]|uniref:Transcription factor domain-containing protein n=1 Tax=Cladophialophora bantiana (strain ATCC 10958 / CBS 173.52 / CDC B-1940 / NIH 8579) TaxID=1442370 RepID=A0A0D2HVZ1_CLAB1|nr:uncharacterized protein Z519_03704 [Cladophialophora bantiana CBS 173.52]KIW95120.1 hypothetical protein Z519_03704 [Cladophialophora bantiana CBS 173.52]